MKIQILWSGCSTCHSLYEKVKNVVKELKLNIEVEYSDDINKMMAMWIMSSPAFIIWDKLITAWRIPSEDEIKEVITWNLKTLDSKSEWGCCSGCC